MTRNKLLAPSTLNTFSKMGCNVSKASSTTLSSTQLDLLSPKTILDVFLLPTTSSAITCTCLQQQFQKIIITSILTLSNPRKSFLFGAK
jgi:hypothetical protein